MNKNKEEQYFLNNCQQNNNISEEEKKQAKLTAFLMILNAIKWACIIILAPFAIMVFAIIGAASDTSRGSRGRRRR